MSVSSARRAASPRAANMLLRTPSLSRSQAVRYIVCRRFVNETPENTRSRALKTLTLLEAFSGVLKSCSTAVADSPDSPNFVMTVRARTSSWPDGTKVDTRVSRGIKAVRAWEASTMQRSIPDISRNRRTHRPANDSDSLWLNAMRSSEGRFMPVRRHPSCAACPEALRRPVMLVGVAWSAHHPVRTSDQQRHSGRQQREVPSPSHRGIASRDAELAQDTAHVRPDGVDRDEHGAGDLLGRQE